MNKNILKIRYTSTNLRVDEYFSWISDVLRWQGKFDINIILLDIPELLCFKQKISIDNYIGIAGDLLSLGVNFNKVNLVFQSQLPEIQEMTSYLQYIQSVNRSTSDEFIIHLETAIAFIFSGDIILVDKNEIKKVEIIRDLISKFNVNFGEKIRLPQSFLLCNSKLMGLDGKEKLDNNNCLFFSDSQDILKKKIITAVTDSGSVINFDIENKPYVSNLMNLYQLLTDKTYDEIENEFFGKKYFEFKNAIFEKLGEFLKLNVKIPNAVSRQSIKKLLLESNKRTEKKLRNNLEAFKKIVKFPKF